MIVSCKKGLGLSGIPQLTLFGPCYWYLKISLTLNNGCISLHHYGILFGVDDQTEHAHHDTSRVVVDKCVLQMDGCLILQEDRDNVGHARSNG